MKSVYLIDTDWIIDQLNGVNKIRQRLKEFRPFGLAISIISVAELYEGVYYSNNQTLSQHMLDELLAQFEILAIDDEICKIFGRERGILRRNGMILSDFDLLIASTCLRWNLTLLTNNRKHFAHMAGLKMIPESK